MRLTLRTLLAYLDGNLEPDDADDIGKKIEESEFASKLVHAIRDCTQRPRLPAPPLVGRGLGADPNTVAEYLEYRLSDERVPEFERICLESEVHLAEVASCHQILTLVLGEPAALDPHTRERLYALASRADESSTSPGDAMRQAVATPVQAPPAGGSVPPVVRRHKPEVPDYLREKSWSIWPIVAIVLVAASLTFAGLFFFGPAPFRESVTAMVAPTAAKEPAEKTAVPTDDTATPGASHDEPETTVLEDSSSEVDEAEVMEPPVPTDADSESPPVPLEEAPAGDDEPAALEPEPSTPDPVGIVQPSRKPAMDAEDSTAPIPPDPSSLAGPDAVPGTLPPGPLATARTAPLPGEEMPGEPMPLPVAAPGGASPTTPAPAPAEGFGRFMSRLLLKFDPALGEWMRLPAQAPLNKGDQLMSLPLFSPLINLSTNISVQPDGPAEFELVGWDDEGTPIIAVHYGRLLMATVGRAGNKIRLQIDGSEPVLTFVDPESTLDIEVMRKLPAGKNPESGPAPLVANVYATSGIIRVVRDNVAPVELQAPSVLSLVGGTDEQPRTANSPTGASDNSDAENRAAREIESNLLTDKPVSLQLREIIDPQNHLSRRREVQSLAIRCLTYLNDFGPAEDALNDADLKYHWPAIMRELQDAIARSPETAIRVRKAFESKRGDADGRALYRMLWGYSTTDLQTGADRDLLDALARDDALDFRVLGILNLQELSGGANYGYYPGELKVKRDRGYNQWKARIGKLVPRSK